LASVAAFVAETVSEAAAVLPDPLLLPPVEQPVSTALRHIAEARVMETIRLINVCFI
jgi:hypothetical protein